MSRPRSLRQTLAGAVALAVVAGGAVLLQELSEPAPQASLAQERAQEQAQDPAQAPADAAEGATRDGLPTVSAASLPLQARETLSLIDRDGPFPYDQDGSVFGNREGLLPQERRGCYREYTVETPGEDDRGARRIVTSCAGPRYWTADHYESFRRIVPARL